MTAYRLAKALQGRFAASTAYRLVERRGVLSNYDAELLEALCEVFEVDARQLFEGGDHSRERERLKREDHARSRARKRRRQ